MVPLRIITICWAIRSTMERMCEVRNTVTPCRATDCSRSRMIFAVTGSMASNGSSRNSTCGIGQQRHGERRLLAHAVGAGGGEGAPAVFQAQRVQQLRRARAGLLPRHAVDIAGQQEVLFHREIVEQSEIFRQDADAPLQLQGIGGGIRARTP